MTDPHALLIVLLIGITGLSLVMWWELRPKEWDWIPGAFRAHYRISRYTDNRWRSVRTAIIFTWFMIEAQREDN